MPNLSYEEAKKHLESDPEMLRVARAIMGMNPDEQPVEFEETVDRMRGEYHDHD